MFIIVDLPEPLVPDDGHELAVRDREVHVAHRVHDAAARVVVLRHVRRAR